MIVRRYCRTGRVAMSARYAGSCLCGEVRFEVVGDFESFFLCHCGRCQKDTGSAHAANLFSSTASINWLSGRGKIKTFRVPSTRHVKSFCSECGSALPGLQMTLLKVPAGSLDSAIATRPSAHIFVASAADWDMRLEDVPRFDVLPTSQPHE